MGDSSGGTFKGRAKGGNGGPSSYEAAFPALRAAAKAKAKAKASTSTAPWARTAPTSTRVDVDQRRKKTDPTYPAVIQLIVAKQSGNDADIVKAEEELERQRSLQESALPPDRRLAALRKKLRAAEASVAKFEVRVDEISKELDDTADRLHEARLGLQAQQARTRSIQSDIDSTERLIEAPADKKALKPGLVGAPPLPAQMKLDDHLAGIQNFFMTEFELSEHSASELASYLH